MKKKKIKIAVLLGQLSYLGGVGFAAVNEVKELRKKGIANITSENDWLIRSIDLGMNKISPQQETAGNYK